MRAVLACSARPEAPWACRGRPRGQRPPTCRSAARRDRASAACPSWVLQPESRSLATRSAARPGGGDGPTEEQGEQLASEDAPTAAAAQLLEAAESGDWEEVASLAQAGVPVTCCDQYGTSPLYYAVRQANVDAVELLLSHGADPNAKFAFDRTPLALVLWKDGNPGDWPLTSTDRELVATLVAGGADINAPVEADPCQLSACTLLHWAAYSNAVDAIRVLAACGADLEVRDATVDDPGLGRWTEFVGGGQTPLMVAAANGHVEAVKALIAAGCNVNAGTTDWGSWSPKGATALDFAVVGPGSGCQPGARNPEGLPAVVKALLAAGAGDVEFALKTALEWNASQEVIAALQAALDEEGSDSVTATSD